MDEIVVFLREQLAEDVRLAEAAMSYYEGEWTASSGPGNGYQHPDGPHVDTGDDLYIIDFPAVEAGAEAAKRVGELVASHVIPRPHADLLKQVGL